MSFTVKLIDGQLKRSGRPEFISSAKRDIEVKAGLEDRRHILHGATQITDVLIDSFNRIIRTRGSQALEVLINGFLQSFKQRRISFRISAKANLVTKIMKVVTIAFSNPCNLVVGVAVQNQGIEKARETIHTIRKKIDQYCALTILTFDELKTKVLELTISSLKNSSEGDIGQYRIWILRLLKKSIKKSTAIVEIVRVLFDFEFSCTLDIIHNSTTKRQNIWGLTMANKLNQAISSQDEQAIYKILL